jgi:cytochrome c553
VAWDTRPIPEAPSLAGQSAVYLTQALNDYRSGARKNDMMSLVAPTLKDKDVEDLAAYYSAIEVAVSSPPREFVSSPRSASGFHSETCTRAGVRG